MNFASLAGKIVFLCTFIVVPALSYSEDFKELWKEKGGTVKEVDRQQPAKMSPPQSAPAPASRGASSYDNTWDDYRKPFTQLVRVPGWAVGTSTVYLDLPEDMLNRREQLTLNLDIESNIVFKIDGLEQKTFEKWSAYCSVNGAGFFGKHRIRVNDLPARQITSISISTKDLKVGRNTFEFSMASTGLGVTWKAPYQITVAYGIHRMWFSEFWTPSQGQTIEKVKDVPVDKPSKRQGDTEIEKKLIELKRLLDQGLINQEDYDRKKAELLDQL